MAREKFHERSSDREEPTSAPCSQSPVSAGAWKHSLQESLPAPLELCASSWHTCLYARHCAGALTNAVIAHSDLEVGFCSLSEQMRNVIGGAPYKPPKWV